MRQRFVAMLACALAALLLLPVTAFAQDFTPNARLDDNGVLHWDAEGEYSGSLTISGNSTELTATGGAYIGAGDELVINGGEVSVDVTIPASEDIMAALYGNNAVRISGGTVDAAVHKADDNDTAYAIISNGVVEFTGGTVTLEGDTGAIYVSKNGGSVSFGGTDWYQWTTMPGGTPVRSEDEPYTYGEDARTYLRIEPAVPIYELTIVDGTGASTVVGSYVEGARVSISAEAFDANGHFSGWTQNGAAVGSFDDPSAAQTTFTMPAGAVELTANYDAHSLAHHDGQDPTCTDPGWAAYDECACGYSTYQEIPAAGHSFVDGV